MMPPEIVSLYERYLAGRMERDEFEERFSARMGYPPTRDDYQLLDFLSRRKQAFLEGEYEG